MGGDYTRAFPIYGGQIVGIDLPTYTNVMIAAKGPTRQICVQRVFLSVSVYAPATLILYNSISGNPVGQFVVPANAGNNPGGAPLSMDFGARGSRLTAGANLLLSGMVTGLQAHLHIFAYQSGPPAGPRPYVAPSTAGTT